MWVGGWERDVWALTAYVHTLAFPNNTAHLALATKPAASRFRPEVSALLIYPHFVSLTHVHTPISFVHAHTHKSKVLTWRWPPAQQPRG